MTISIHTYEVQRACGKLPLEFAFMRHLQPAIAKGLERCRASMRVYDLTACRIIQNREATAPEGASPVDWQYTDWAGLMITVHLGPREGFDTEFLMDSYEVLKNRTINEQKITHAHANSEPDGQDYADIRRRTWTFWCGEARCSLAAFAHGASEVCKLVEDGVETKYKMVCNGSPLE